MSSNSLPKPPISRAPRLRQPASPAATDFTDLATDKDTEFTASMQLAYLESVVKDWQEQGPAAGPDSRITPPAAPADESIKAPLAVAVPKNIRPVTIAKSLFAVAVALALGW